MSKDIKYISVTPDPKAHKDPFPNAYATTSQKAVWIKYWPYMKLGNMKASCDPQDRAKK